MGFASGFLRADSLSPLPGGYRLTMQLPWMRSLPLSSVVALDVTLDGVAASGADLTFHVKGETLSFDDLAGRWDDFWFIQERVDVDVASSVRVVPGERHAVTASAALRIPYIITPAGPMVIEPSVTHDLVVQETP